MDRSTRTVEDVLRLLDGLFAPGHDRWTGGAADWWDDFYADRDRPVPFFVAKPDESLVSCLDRGLVPAGRALDLGCGLGRNALLLAERGFEVDAVDLSPAALGSAPERARAAGLDINFLCGDVFAADTLRGPYRLIHDSGCFHHLPPHRRISHLALLDRLLEPGGYFSLVCFAAGRMGSELSDADLYRAGGLGGGLAYSPGALRHVFSGLEEIELRAMRPQPPDSALFGEPFLWTALFRRPAGGVADVHPQG
ncbi:class I SAM-dependent methyltransferase [Streptomyces sp. NPDC094031]|uniref:class I SAM-dependent methyltransferase n=1 Tax=Streptomyces sp. NPDC094031 TaxID=3155307 RepID=UPI00331CFF2F